MNVKAYNVEVTGPNGRGEVTSEVLEIFATNADNAKKEARRQLFLNGHTRHDGKLTYRATRAK